MEKFQGFFSYASKNAKAAPEIIAAFSGKLGELLASKLANAEFEVWRDINEIRVGEVWREELAQAIRESHIFIAMMSPAWFSSKVCAEEYAAFLEVERTRGHKLIVPILIDALGDQEQFLTDAQRHIYEELKTRQHKDMGQASYFAMTADKRMEMLSLLADDVRAMITNLRKKAPKPAPGGPSAETLPGDPKMIGRVKEKEALIAALLGKESPVIVPGGPGMGKTTLALAAAHDRKIKKHFKVRAFVALDGVREAHGVLAGLAQSLGLEARGGEMALLPAIAARCEKDRALVILDNFETPYQADATACEALLGKLGGVTGLMLTVTVRGAHPPGKPLPDIPELKDGGDRTLFLRYAGDEFAGDAELPDLLMALDGHPLSIRLIASQAQGGPSLATLAEDWRERRAQLFEETDDRMRSTRASLRLSLQVGSMTGNARRLVGALAYLQAGMALDDIAAILLGCGAAEAQILRRLRLVRKEERLSMLAPLRDCARLDATLAKEDHERLIRHYLAIAERGGDAGREAWQASALLVEAEAGNFDDVIREALGTAIEDETVDRALQGIAQLSRIRGIGGVSCIATAVEKAKASGGNAIAARNLSRLGDIAYARSDHEEARARYGAAMPLYRQVGDLLGEANCIQSLGDIDQAEERPDIARQRFETALALYARAQRPYSVGFAHQRLMEVARDDAERARHREEARAAWQGIGRLDLIEKLLK